MHARLASLESHKNISISTIIFFHLFPDPSRMFIPLRKFEILL